MKNKIFIIFILMVVLIVPTINLAQAETPLVKVIAEGTTTSTNYLYDRQVPNGKAQNEIGAWYASYYLNIRWEFWNVGEDGGEKYAEGIMTSTFVNGVNGRVVVSRRVHEDGTIGVSFEPSSDTPPDLPNYILKLRFSGGPNGVFSNEDGTILQTKLTPDGYGGFTIPGTPILVVQNPEAFKDWNLPTITTMPWAKDEVARFSGLTGQVEYLLPGANRDSDWKIARLESVLPRGTHIRTIDDSVAIISCADMSNFILKPESEIVLTTPEEKDSKLKILAGNMWGNVKKMVDEGSMEIEMNQAVAGIKGTTFVVSEINGVSSLKVIDGKVAFTAKVDGKTVEVAGGNTVSASNAGLSSIESFDVAKETADWNAVSASIPEFPTWIILATLLIITTLVAIVIKRKSVH